MPAPIYFSNGRQVTPEEALKLGENVSPQDLSNNNQIKQQAPAQTEEPIPTINPIESKYNEFGSPLESLQNNIFNPIGKAFNYAGQQVSKGINSLSNTGSDITNWADRNRVGLGGFATAIGAGLAKRDAGEALARYNQSIINSKQQQQEEEKFKMATDANHPYNQQFRELFAKMLPDVTARLGENFNKMTVQNFKDAGMGDLPDLIMKQLEVSKNDSNSPISKRTRDMAKSQYNIDIPENVSANEVPKFIEAYKIENELKNKKQELGIKQGKLEVEGGKAFHDIQNKEDLLKIKQAEESRNQQMFEPQLKEQKAKAEVASKTQQDQIDLSKAQTKAQKFAVESVDAKSDLSKEARIDFLKTNPKYSKLINSSTSYKDIKEFETKVIPELIRSEATNLTSIQRQKIQSGAYLEAQRIKDRNANLREGLKIKLGYARLGETSRHNVEMEKLGSKKLNDKYADTYISQGDLNSLGLTQPSIQKKLESGSGARELMRNANIIMNNIDNIGLTDAMGLTQLSGQLQSLYTSMGLDVKQNKALGAYDQGVRDLLNEMAVNPNSAKAYAKKQYLKGQYKSIIDSINNTYKSKSVQQKWDERLGSPVDYTLKLNKAVIDHDPESIQEFSDLGYGSDDLMKAYNNSMTIRRKGE